MPRPLHFLLPLAATLAAALSLPLSGEEPEAGARPLAPADAAFRRADRNGDGKVTPDELPQAELFQRMDLDGDGVITLEETRRAFAAMGRSGESPGDQARPDPGAIRELRGLRGSGEGLFRQADRNGDGVLTPDEISSARLFALLDQNGDGQVTLAEATAALAAVRAGDSPLPPPSAPPAPERTSGPERLKPGDAGVGRQAPDLEFTALDQPPRRLSELGQGRGTMIAWTSVTCPVSKRYAPSLARLESQLQDQGIGLLLVNPFASESEESLRQALADHGFTAPCLHDTSREFSAALGARSTAEVILLDAARTVVYRGALDDQYGIDYSRDAPRNTYLLDAVEALLAGRLPGIAATTAPGCELDLDRAADGAGLAQGAGGDGSGLTWHRDISRILRQHCAECHREGGIAPFALDDFSEVADRARVIRRVIEEGTMPPWHAAPPPEGEPSPWANDRSLSAAEKADLLAWLASPGRDLGDEADSPLPLDFGEEGWTRGQPDAVFSLPRPVAVKAEGEMPYVNLTVPTGLSEDKWVQGFEILPGAREVVHHVIVFAIDPALPEQRFNEADGYFALYVPGTASRFYPPGLAKRLPAGASLRFQMHYTPNGAATEDITRIGFHWAEEPPRHEVKVASAANPRIRIPAGAPDHRETALRAAPADITVLGFLPHLHVRGKAFRYEVADPDGEFTTVLDVPRYDFNWQLFYHLKDPLHLPRGTRLRATAWYDNSEGNPANPDPSKEVRWGSQSHDEMLIGYLEYYEPGAAPPLASSPPRP